MNPPAQPVAANMDLDDIIGDEVAVTDGLSQEEVLAMLREAEESGMCEQSLDEIFIELFEKNFGRKPTLDERSPQRTGQA